MKPRTRRYARNGLIALGVFLLACWVAPSYFSAERYRRRLEVGLERSLNRPVTFGAVTYRLLPRPGFSIENAVVHEDPAFGFEPFARVDQINCDLRWRSLLRSRLDCARLILEHPTLNFVRNERAEWNVESFLQKNRLASPGASGGTSPVLENLDVAVEDARIDFSMGTNKKPFALTDLDARLNYDRQRGILAFQLEGSPVRTDLSLPSPGVVQFEGQWTPGASLEGPLDAALRTRGASVYHWIPLLSGYNPEIYGLLDAQVHVTGSLHHPKLEGQASFTQLHRWEQNPPVDPMPTTIFFRGAFDRTRGRAEVESLDATFFDSHIHLTGSVDKIPASPVLDLVVAVERSRVEDFLSLARRFTSSTRPVGVTGRVDALVSIQGPWNDRHCSGFIGGRGLLIATPSENFPVSNVDIRVEDREAHLEPVQVLIAPRVELIVEGSLAPASLPPTSLRALRKATHRPTAGPLRYEISAAAKTVPLQDVVKFGRALGFYSAPGVDARGTASGTFKLSGAVWPLQRPSIDGAGDLHAANLLVPGFTEPLQIPKAHVQVAAGHIIADPVVAVLGTTVFTSRFEHQGDRSQPWEFEIHADRLSLEQGSLWFDVMGRRQPIPLLERLPGLGSSRELRAAASSFFGALNLKGEFASPLVTYRDLSFTDFQSEVEVSGRVIKVSQVTFRAGGGKGEGKLAIDLTKAPARVTIDAAMTDGSLQLLAVHLPPQLRKLRGLYSGTAHFETHGLSSEETTDNLQGRASVHLKNVFLGDLDPLEAVVRQRGWGTLERPRGDIAFRSADAALEVHDRRVVLGNLPLEFAGAKIDLKGAWAFDGALSLEVRADLGHMTRRWANTAAMSTPSARTTEIHLEGSFNRLAVVPELATARGKP